MSHNSDQSATKADIRCLDRKIDASVERLDHKMGASFNRLAVEIVKTNGRIDDLKDQMTKTLLETKESILTALDRYSRVAEANNRAVTLHGGILTEVHLKLQDHDRRLSRLEAPRARFGPGL